MKQCKDCIHYEICDPYVSPAESFPEVKGGCKCFKPIKGNGLVLKINSAMGYFPREFIVEAIKTHIEVTRCKDCKYWQDNNGGYPHDECRWGKDETPDADDFCSFGVRRDLI